MRSRRFIGLLAVALAACAPSTLGSDVAPIIDSRPGCDTCVSDVVACVSTSRDDDQFVECRDLFLACQKKADVLDECTSPEGDEACAACDEQRAICEKTGGDSCDADLGECVKRFGVEGACADVEDPPPDDEPPTCEEDPSQCETSSSMDGSGSGGAGGGGEGGGEGGGPVSSCGNPCEWGGPASPDCGSCQAAVCDLDSYCCDTAWDGACVSKAQQVPECGCEAPADQCAHFECQTGDPLDATCSDCAQQVCAADDFCCTNEWDAACVGIASQTAACGCSTCAHDPCAEGDKLEKACSNCVGTVCAQDSYCCDTAWDATCVGIAAMKPECGCGS